MSILKKGLRVALLTLLALVLSANLFIILSGRFYLYKGIANTYLRGRTSPSIYDQNLFYNRTVPRGESTYPIPEHGSFNRSTIPQQYRKLLESLGTRAFIVIRRDSVIYQEFWDNHDPKTVSNSFSISKTLTALLIGIAIDEGKIKSLDEPVANYIPEFVGDERREITIRHLLQMSSGLDWTESSKNPLSDNAASYYGTDLYGLVTRQKRITPPNKTFIYQSGNSQLLGFILKKATGKTVSRYASEKIWSKIGMEYNAMWNLDKEGGDEKAFCCLYATALDYAKLGLLLEHEGRFKGKQIIPLWYYNEMIKPSSIGTEDGIPNYRYGLHIWTYAGAESPVYYCRGIKGQYLITIPEEDLVIVRLGLDRKEAITLPVEKRNDLRFLAKNKYKIGHSACLFEYIALGKWIAAQTDE